MEFTCAVEHRSGAAIVHAAGEIDLASAPELRQVLIDVLAAAPTIYLVVDLSAVDFLDSTGIGVIVGAHRRVTTNGGRFSAVVATPMVRKALQTTGLLGVLHVSGSVEDALDDV